jgi:hypothetical protein
MHEKAAMKHLTIRPRYPYAAAILLAALLAWPSGARGEGYTTDPPASADSTSVDSLRWRGQPLSDNVIDCRPNQGFVAAVKCWWYS